MPVPCLLCGGEAVLFEAVEAMRRLLLQTQSQCRNGIASASLWGLLLLLFGVVYHELEEGREGGAVPPMAGSNCSPAELG